MTVRVLFFAMCREAAGCDEFDLDLPDSSDVADLWRHLTDRFPSLHPYQKISRVAVNCRYAAANDAVRDGDEVSVIPPVSGG